MLYKASLGTRPLHAEEEEGLVLRLHKALLVNCRLPIPWTWGILLMTRDVCYCLTRTLMLVFCTALTTHLMKVSRMKLSIGKISNGLYGSDKDLNAPCTL